jgi:hypothetical protein
LSTLKKAKIVWRWSGGEQDLFKITNPKRLSPTACLSELPNILDEERIAEILLVGDGPQVFSLSIGQLERIGCRCHFARSQRGLEELLNQKQFDIVLTMHRIEGGSTDWLGAALSGSRTTLFYALPVEVGCWWVPVLRFGAECLGSPALRPREFADALDRIVDEIRTTVAKKVS